MAINFLDAITVNSGTGSASTIVASGARPVTIKGGAIGSVAIGGSNGGWATGYLFTGYNGTNRGGFGALGSVDTLTYYYIGDDYNDTTMVIKPNAGNVGIGTTNPSTKLHISAVSSNSQLTLERTGSATGKWSIHTNTDNLFFNNAAGSSRLVILDNGSVGIGTTSPSDGDLTIGTPRLHVATGGTSGTFNLAARFQSTTTDADNTGTSILINSLNDRGLLIKAGRKDGDREVAYFDLVTSIGNTTNMLTMGKFGSAYNAGIGTATPAAKLDVNGDTIVRGNVGINGATSIDSPLDIAAASTSNNALLTKWYYSPNAETYNLQLKQTVTAGVVRYNFSMVNNSTAYNDVLVLDRGKVGVGTTAPVGKLHVSNGYLRVEGAGCGIQMPDTSGNPLLAITTDQNTFAGCNIVNGWGNSSNTGVGVGTTRSDGTAFQVKTGVTLSAGLATNSGTQRLIVYGDGKTKITKSLGVGANASATTGRIDASNDVVAFSTSDIRLKDNIKSIDKALDKVNKIQGVEFDWIEKEEVHGNSGHDIGVIAQEIEKILPDVVTTRDNGYKAVKYEKIVPLLIEAIKDLSRQVDGLKRLI